MKRTSTATTNTERLTAALCIALGVTAFFIQLFTPYAGDDLAYLSTFNGAHATYDSLWQYPRAVASHWLHSNGRSANYLLVLLTTVCNRGFVALMCGAMTGAMYWFAARLSCRRSDNPLITALLRAAWALGLPWWDSMMLFACQFNYVWATAMSLAAAWMILYRQPRSRTGMLIACIFCATAGAMHEAASAPLLAGLVSYAMLNRDVRCGANRQQRLLLASFAVGVAEVMLSPGIWMRLGSASAQADDALLPLLLKSAPLGLALIACIAAMACTRRGRAALAADAHTPIVVWIIAAVGSTAFCAVSGVVGRSGWWAETYTLMAATLWLSQVISPKPRTWHYVAAAGIALVLLAREAGLVMLQHSIYKEQQQFEDLYRTSPDGVVFLDATPDDAQPWWTLNRLRGVPDADDAYLLQTFADYYSPKSLWPTVLPTEAATLDYSALGDTVLGCGDRITSTLPAEARTYASAREGVGVMMFSDSTGCQYVIQPFTRYGKHFYHITRRIIDPGDR